MNADISVKQAKRALEHDSGILLVDVRTPQEHKRGHIAGSINIPLEQIKTILVKAPNKHTRIFLYCKSGIRSDEAKETLIALGYTNVTNIGGIHEWELI